MNIKTQPLPSKSVGGRGSDRGRGSIVKRCNEGDPEPTGALGHPSWEGDGPGLPFLLYTPLWGSTPSVHSLSSDSLSLTFPSTPCHPSISKLGQGGWVAGKSSFTLAGEEVKYPFSPRSHIQTEITFFPNTSYTQDKHWVFYEFCSRLRSKLRRG